MATEPKTESAVNQRPRLNYPAGSFALYSLIHFALNNLLR